MVATYIKENFHSLTVEQLALGGLDLDPTARGQFYAGPPPEQPVE